MVVYLGQKKEPGEKKEYMQFSHSLFHAYTDPAPLFLDVGSDTGYWADEADGFSNRVMQLATSQYDSPKHKKLRAALTTVEELVKTIKTERDKVRFADVYWLDVERAGVQRTCASLNQIKAYLRISGTELSKVKAIVRGHQGVGLWFSQDAKQRVIVTTIDPSQIDDQQIYLTYKIAAKVKDWERSEVYLDL